METYFESFNPKRYSTDKKYITGKYTKVAKLKPDYTELCANCGYPAGMHYGITKEDCPNVKINKKHYPDDDIVIPFKL